MVEGAGPRVGVPVGGEKPAAAGQEEWKPWCDFGERATKASKQTTVVVFAAAAAAAISAVVAVGRVDVLQRGP